MIRILPAVFLFSFICWAIVQANNGSSNIFFELISIIPYGDKLGHFILYGSLSALTVIALHYKSLTFGSFQIPVGAIIILAIAIVEEVSQLYLLHRTFDFVDIFADIAGIITFTLLCQWYHMQKI